MSTTCVKFSALLLIVLTCVHLPQCLIVLVCQFISPLCVSFFNHFLIILRPLLQLTPVNQLVLDWTKVGWSTILEEHKRDESIEIKTRTQYLGQTFLKGEDNDLFLFLHCMSFFFLSSLWCVSSLSRSLQARLETSKALTRDYTAAEVCQQRQSEKYTHQPLYSDKYAERKIPFNLFFFSIQSSVQTVRILFSPFFRRCRDNKLIHGFHLLARRMIIQPWHFPALQRNGLGESLVCRLTPARTSLRRDRTPASAG